MNFDQKVRLKLSKTGVQALIEMLKNSVTPETRMGIMAFFIAKRIYLRLLIRYANMKPRAKTTFSMHLAEAIAISELIEPFIYGPYHIVVSNELTAQIHQILIS